MRLKKGDIAIDKMILLLLGLVVLLILVVMFFKLQGKVIEDIMKIEIPDFITNSGGD